MNNKDDQQVAEKKIGALENLHDWKVHSDDPDIRGWNIYTANGEKVGKVENLIADTGRKEVLYVEVELDDDLNSYRDPAYRERLHENQRRYYGEEEDRHIILPIGMIEIDEEQEKVVASRNLTKRHFANCPRYIGSRKGAVEPAYEYVVVRFYADQDDNYRNVYSDDKYDFDTLRKSPYISDNRFYESDFFSRDRYTRRYNADNTTMASVDTGASR